MLRRPKDPRLAPFVLLAAAWAALSVLPAGCAGADRTPRSADALRIGSGVRVELASLPEFQLPADPEPVPDATPPNEALGQGSPAPFDGILVTAEWMTWHHEVVLQRDELKVKAAAWADLIPKLHGECLDGLARTAAAAELKWWEDPALNRWAGFLLGVGLTIGGIFAADAIDDQVEKP